MKNLHVYVVALVLTAVGLGLAAVKWQLLGLPLTPDKETEVWQVEARVDVRPEENRPLKVGLQIPDEPPGMAVLDEDFISSNYGLAVDTRGYSRRAVWSVRRAHGEQTLYYRIALHGTPGRAEGGPGPRPPFPERPELSGPEGTAIQALLDRVRHSSADIASFTQQVILRLTSPDPDSEARMLWEQARSDPERVELIRRVLAGARIPSRTTHVLRLQDGMRAGSLEPWLEVHDGEHWIAFDFHDASRGYPPDVLLWKTAGEPLVQVSGGSLASVSFAAARTARDVIDVAQQRAERMGSRLLEFSLLGLPIEMQNVYRVLLLVPLGALVVVFVRNVVGMQTFGTFMPILVALAFRETELLWGVVFFTVMVALGLLLRRYLEHHKLLLVPRLASVLIIVILLMAVISVFSHQLHFTRGLSVALFPMVILAMTIERMSVTWEENGAWDAIRQGVGTLVVASLGYLAMNIPLLQHLVFVFPELLLVLLALTLLLGRYTGYRLTELWRFRHAELPGR